MNLFRAQNKRNLKMRKIASFTVLATCLVLPTVAGCGGGGGENTVIEAPPEAFEEEAAMEGMSDEDYDAAMEADMQGGDQ
jgi:hypothetical protein